MTDSAAQLARAEGLKERVFNVRLTKGEVLRDPFPKDVPVRVRLFGSRQGLGVDYQIQYAVWVQFTEDDSNPPPGKAVAYHVANLLTLFQLKICELTMRALSV
jgi:hypothetical protein